MKQAKTIKQLAKLIQNPNTAGWYKYKNKSILIGNKTPKGQSRVTSMYWRRRNQGLCVNCPKKATQGRLCKKHAKKMSQYRKTRRKALKTTTKKR